MNCGKEWVVEAYGCDPAALSSLDVLQRLFQRMSEDLRLQPVAEPLWHQFPPPGGITGLVLLSESHWACHSFPEHGTLCLNLFCCRPRGPWDFRAVLKEFLGAASVAVREMERRYHEP